MNMYEKSHNFFVLFEYREVIVSVDVMQPSKNTEKNLLIGTWTNIK